MTANITPEHKKLNLGSGFKKLLDHWNVDSEPRCNPDQVVDLEHTPWPWEDGFFDHIRADNILEHLGSSPDIFTQVIKEMYRVSSDTATWCVVVPHHRCDLYWDDYTHVRVLTPKTFRMFDQKVNTESIQQKLSDSTFGIYHDVDIEVTDVTYNLVGYWREQLNSGWIGSQELDLKLNTLNNVAESVTILIRVHKPQRYAHLVK